MMQMLTATQAQHKILWDNKTVEHFQKYMWLSPVLDPSNLIRKQLFKPK